MSNDPSPEQTPGLEPGNSMAPGDTPPAEGSESGVNDRQPDLPSQRTNKIVYGLVIGVSAIVALMFLAYAVDIF
jgi:hypothetical protein